MLSQRRLFSLYFMFPLAVAVFLEGCGQSVPPPPAVQNEGQLGPEQGLAALTRKAEAGDAESQFNFGQAYVEGKGVPKDEVKAMEWFQKAATQGLAKAQFQLGTMHANGDGTPKDGVKAVEWYQKAAAQGHDSAQFKMGVAYSEGNGVPKDKVKAVEWYQKAAAQGHVSAQTLLGIAFSDGEGVPKDKVKAVEWYQKAATQGSDIAQALLAEMYGEGDGVPKDRVLAYAWVNLAAQSVPGVAKIRDSWEAELSVAERAEAQRLSSNWIKGQTIARERQHATVSSTKSLSKKGSGTAFVVSKSGQAITNHHVIDGCQELRVDGREGIVTVITSDKINDVALIQLSAAVNETATIASDPTGLRQGEEIVVYGYPLNSILSSGGNLTPGVVSALTGLGNNTNQIQITAPIQPGSSGSPVLNKRGEVVGVVSMKLDDVKMAKATGQIGQNANFAISGQTLKAFLDTHKVAYNIGSRFFSRERSAADLADEARRWTLIIGCWK